MIHKQPPKMKLSTTLSNKSGTLMISTRAVNSIRRRPRSSFKILLETSALETSSPKRLSMRSSPPSTRTAPVPSRSQRWLPSSSNFSEETERAQWFNTHIDPSNDSPFMIICSPWEAALPICTKESPTNLEYCASYASSRPVTLTNFIKCSKSFG